MRSGPKAPDYDKAVIESQTDVVCQNCDFENRKWIDRNNARRIARNHMRETGHQVCILIGVTEIFTPNRKVRLK